MKAASLAFSIAAFVLALSAVFAVERHSHAARDVTAEPMLCCQPEVELKRAPGVHEGFEGFLFDEGNHNR